MVYGVIYMLKNKLNNKVYIGKTKQGVEKRYKQHLLATNNTKILDYNLPVHRAMRKYGFSNFELSVIDSAYNLEDLNTKEKYWISKYNSTDSSFGYNLCKGGDGGSPVIISEKTREKFRKNSTGKTMIHDSQKTYRINKEDLQKYLDNGFQYGPKPYTRSKDFKSKVSFTLSNMVAINNGVSQTRVKKEELNHYLSQGWVKGWIKKNKAKQIRIYRSREEDSKVIYEDELTHYLSEGWIVGNKPWHKEYNHKRGYTLSEKAKKNLSESHKGNHPCKEAIEKQRQKLKGRIVINKEGRKKYIYSNQLDYYVSQGWKKGGISTKTKKIK